MLAKLILYSLLTQFNLHPLLPHNCNTHNLVYGAIIRAVRTEISYLFVKDVIENYTLSVKKDQYSSIDFCS